MLLAANLAATLWLAESAGPGGFPDLWIALGGAVLPFGMWSSLSVRLRPLALAHVGLLSTVCGACALVGGREPALSALVSVGFWGGWTVLTSRGSAWILVLVWELDTAREAQARLAVAEERLRFGRDLHDVMGRNLAVIALKSELAVQLAQRGRPEAVDQMVEVQRIARESQREVREVVRGYRRRTCRGTGGRAGVLRAAGSTAGPRATTGRRCRRPVQSALGWVVREGTTNVLRHGDARQLRRSAAGRAGRSGGTDHGERRGGRPRRRTGAARDGAGGNRTGGDRADRVARARRRPGRHADRGAGRRRGVPADGTRTAATHRCHCHCRFDRRHLHPRYAEHGRRRMTNPTGPARPLRPPGPMGPPGPPRRACALLLADDEHLIRGALAALLVLEDDLLVVAEAASGPEALAMARAHRPDVAVLDLEMPGADGVAVATSLRAELPGCRTMIVTGHGRPGHLKRALAAGVRGFVPKTVSAQRLAEIIRTVHAGNRYVDPELAADAISAGDSPLTVREAEVLELAADGAPVAEIAQRAALSPGTVRNYLSSAASKLGAENRHAAARLARERGWV